MEELSLRFSEMAAVLRASKTEQAIIREYLEKRKLHAKV